MLAKRRLQSGRCHAGEYTTGFGLNSAKTDKGAGVVALTMFDLRKRGMVGDLHLAGTNGTKLPAIRAHMKAAIGDAYPASAFDLTCATYPKDDEVDPAAYVKALAVLPKGSAVTVFTPVSRPGGPRRIKCRCNSACGEPATNQCAHPSSSPGACRVPCLPAYLQDDTHFDIAMACVKAGHHVLVTKPIVMTLDQHLALAKAAEEANVLVAVVSAAGRHWSACMPLCSRMRWLCSESAVECLSCHNESLARIFVDTVAYPCCAYALPCHRRSTSGGTRSTRMRATACASSAT